MKITISQLRVLEAVARTGSFSRAAEELGITQPSVSTQLRAIETQSRSRLLARNGHTITPTRLGNLILPRVRALVTMANELERILGDERSLERGVLRIGYSTHQFAMPVVSRFMAAYPGIKVEARSMATQDLINLMQRGLVDVAFVTGQQPPPGFSAEELLRNDIVLMIPSDHPLAGRHSVTWTDIIDHPLIRREETSGTRMIFDQAAEAAGVTLKTVLDLGSWGSLKAAVEAGIGGCIALEGEIEPDDNISVLRIRDSSLWACHYLISSVEMREVAMVRAFFDTAEIV